MSDRQRPFDAIRRELRAQTGEFSNDEIQVDVDRRRRTGIPEIVLAGRKSTEAIAEALTRLADANGRALATRLSAEQAADIVERMPPRFTCVAHPESRALVTSRDGVEIARRSGRIGVLTAGASDAHIAAEAALIAAEMGCAVYEARDVGVAGLHRLVRPLEAMIEAGVHVLVVIAGMDGALPSVVAGLSPVPVIGVPTSVGYGFGAGGEGALMTMLQSCAPGLVVVNIDNGIGAGATAALIANQAGG